MSLKISWLGHNCWSVDTGQHKLLVDPFLDDSPTAPVKAADVEADFILLSHGHFDHVADAAPIAKRTGATVLANFEVGEWLKKQGVDEDKVEQFNTGGGADFPFGRVAFTIAHHSSSLPDGTYGGAANGLMLSIDGKHLYFACDTALFRDMEQIGLIGMAGGGVDLAVVPIGDRFTMGVCESLEAIKLIGPKRVAPCHYNTWPPIEQDADAWAEQVRQHTVAEPVVVEPGGVITLD